MCRRGRVSRCPPGRSGLRTRPQGFVARLGSEKDQHMCRKQTCNGSNLPSPQCCKELAHWGMISSQKIKLWKITFFSIFARRAKLWKIVEKCRGTAPPQFSTIFNKMHKFSICFLGVIRKCTLSMG